MGTATAGQAPNNVIYRLGGEAPPTKMERAHWSGRVVHELCEELHEPGGVSPAEDDVELQRSGRGHRGDHVDCAAFAGDLDDRGLPDRRPGGPGVEVRPYPRLVAEVQLSTLGAGLPRIAGNCSSFHRRTASGSCW